MKKFAFAIALMVAATSAHAYTISGPQDSQDLDSMDWGTDYYYTQWIHEGYDYLADYQVVFQLFADYNEGGFSSIYGFIDVLAEADEMAQKVQVKVTNWNNVSFSMNLENFQYPEFTPADLTYLETVEEIIEVTVGTPTLYQREVPNIFGQGRAPYVVEMPIPLNPYADAELTYEFSVASFVKYEVIGPVSPVPEPATMLLFGTGLVGLAGFSILRKKK